MKEKIMKLNERATMKFIKARNKAIEIMKDNSGEQVTEEGSHMARNLVIGALILGILYVLFKDTLGPLITERIKALFDFKG